jgi:hypothetical protein
MHPLVRRILARSARSGLRRKSDGATGDAGDWPFDIALSLHRSQAQRVRDD